MSITDELREWGYGFCGDTHDVVTAIADRIDEAHKHAIGYVDDRDPETMAENGWVRLPKDGNGEYVHVGDEVWSLHSDIHFPVETMELTADGWEVDGCDPANLHHYHAPTVEDVLRDACKAYHSLMVESMSDVAHDMPAPSEVIAEYAAKLRLRED